MANNLAELYKEAAEKYGDAGGFYGKDEKKKYVQTNFKELYDKGVCLAEALIDLGVASKEHVGLMADHRTEWAIVDCAIVSCGAADVPRGTDVTESELVHILTHSGAKVVFVEHDKMLAKLNKVKGDLPDVKTIILMDPNSKGESGVLNINDLIAKGKELREKGTKKVEERVAAIQSDDLFTLIYTSGTTGKPKGVMLMHSNMMHQVNEVVPVLNVSQKDRLLSILPVWHIFERLFLYAAVEEGMSTYFTNVRDLRDDLKTVRPTFMASAPRLWESLYLGIYNKMNDPKTPAATRKMFNLAYFFSKHFNAAKRFLTGQEVDYTGRNALESLFKGIVSFIVLLLTAPLNFLLDQIVLKKLREGLGGEFKATCSGGGALPRHVDAFFNDIGIDVIEGYGMTETSPVIACRTFDTLIGGSVGKVAPSAEVQIRDFGGNTITHVKKDGSIEGKRGEKGIIFVRGPQVMKGYYKNEEATKKSLNDGWMDTGDLGMINFKDTLTITGRAKETIVLLGGENVEPVPIENKLTESPLIFQCMVVGQDQKVLGALIIPDFDKLKDWAKENGVSETEPEELASNQKIRDRFKKEIRAFNSAKTGFKSFEQVTPYELITKQFEVGDEMTNLMKLKRHVITEKYDAEIKKMYS
ncbi:MAG: long-chain fatty acid--CoA ligase [Spirochaetota bacterium]